MINNDFGSPLTAEERKLYFLAVLDYDGVSESDRLSYLMRTCKLSKYFAGRMLKGYYPRDARKCLEIADALDIDLEWIIYGESRWLFPRTLRIHMQQVKHYPKPDVDKLLRLMVASRAGLSKACNLVNLVYDGRMSILHAARSL